MARIVLPKVVGLLETPHQKDEQVENANRHFFYSLIWDQKANQLVALSLLECDVANASETASEAFVA